MKGSLTQDLRYMGVSAKQYKVVSLLLILCVSNLCGLPLTAGYLYKELLLNDIIGLNIWVFGFSLTSLLSSLIYSYRLVFFLCFDVNKGQPNAEVVYLQMNKQKSVLML